MATEPLPKIVEQSLKSGLLQNIKGVKNRPMKDQIFALLKFATGDFVGCAESLLQGITSYKEVEFFRKYVSYLYELVDTTPEDRCKFCQDVQDNADDFSGNVILGIVDKLDNINKEKILARLTIAKIQNFISIKDFFRLSSMLERIPYTDLKELPRYITPFYDESGDTELLYSTGALILQTLDANGSNKYILSVLGEKLLRWGLGINLKMEREQGTNVALNYATNDDIDKILNEK